MKHPVSTLSLPILGATLMASPALAHVPMDDAASFVSGLAHPIFGLDHVLAMIAVGLWAQQTGGLSQLKVPVAFVLCMVAGFAMGLLQVPLPFVEPMILASIVVLGLAVSVALRPDARLCIALVGLFALFHGNAHSAEMGVAGAASFGLGFVCATMFLHAAGIGIGSGLAHLEYRFGAVNAWLPRIIGGTTALLGMGLVLA